MASLVIIREFRDLVGDTPVHTFNQATSDGVNASWQLTNAPVVPATDSLFLDGVIQQNGVADTTTSAAIAEGDYQFSVVSAANLSVGQIIFLSTAGDPQKFKITAIDNTLITVNQEFDQAFGSGVSVYIATIDYEINNRFGVIYFTTAPNLDVVMTARYQYTKYSDDIMSTALDQAVREVSIDIGSTADIDNNEDHKTLVFLKAHATIIDREVTKGAASAIKVKQGSTSLDLGGSVRALQQQLEGLRRAYDDTLGRYLMGLLEDSLGSGVVGSEGYING